MVAKDVDASSTDVADVMTANPTCVSATDPATDALTTMIENHFRHLPVVDELGNVVGVLDIARCLNDAITKLEQSRDKSNRNAEDAVKHLISQGGGDGSQAAALQAMLGNLVSQAFGSQSVPTLRSILAGKPSTVVPPSTTIREAAILMTETRKAALVVEENELVGIFGFKDMMTRVVAEELPVRTTPIDQVMTRTPISVSPDITVLDALETMHAERFLTLPVCETDGTVVGIVDVMDVIYGCGGADGWRAIFTSAMDLDEGSVSTRKSTSMSTSIRNQNKSMRIVTTATPFVSDVPAHIPSTLEFHDNNDHNSFTGSTLADDRAGIKSINFASPDHMSINTSGTGKASFKVVCSDKSTHRIRCVPTVEKLLDAIAEKTNIARDRIRIEYEDDEGDVVAVTGDDDVQEAWNLARKEGKQMAKLNVAESENTKLKSSVALVGGGLSGLALIGVIGFLLLRPKNK